MLRDSLPLFSLPPLFMALILALWGIFYLLPIALTHRAMVARARVSGRPRRMIAWIFRGALVVSFVLHWAMCADIYERQVCTMDGAHAWQDDACRPAPSLPASS